MTDSAAAGVRLRLKISLTPRQGNVGEATQVLSSKPVCVDCMYGVSPSELPFAGIREEAIEIDQLDDRPKKTE